MLENLALKVFKTGNNKIVRGDDDKANKIIINLSNKSKKNNFKNLIWILNIKAIKKLTFLISNTKKVFNCLK